MPSSLKGCSLLSTRPGEGQRQLRQKGLHDWRTISAVQGQEPRAPRDTAQDPELPLGQAEARRAQESKDALATGWH